MHFVIHFTRSSIQGMGGTEWLVATSLDIL